MQRTSLVALLLTASIAGCGGGGHDAPAANPQPTSPATQVPILSAGGIWHGLSTDNETLTLLVAETGELRSLVTVGTPPTGPPLFGSGAVVVTGERLDGAYDTGRPFSTSAGHCTFTGTLKERVSMSITVDCTEASGTDTHSTYILGYDNNYDQASSLATLAGNYEFSLSADNFLNIDANGVIFGNYHNGPNCTVNGTVAVIDPLYNLYDVEWHLSLCEAPLTQFEGATLTGFAAANLRGTAAGSVLLLLTGMVAGNLEALSLVYEPAQ